MFKKLFLLVSLIFNFFIITANPTIECPSYFNTNGYFNDIGLLSDAVSNTGLYTVKGTCNTYNMLKSYEGQYATRMRIYTTNNYNVTYIVFRPTQMYDQSIHIDRNLVPCTFLKNCNGMVQQRMQEAFLSLIKQVNIDLHILRQIAKGKIIVAGHSLGGILQLYMSIYLWKEFNVIPYASIGLAGPFIGDQLFANTYYTPLANLTKLWQVEVTDNNNHNNYDGTVEGYNMDHPPDLYIDYKIICGLYVDPLPVDPSKSEDAHFSYGMHDLKNYRLALVGNNCQTI